MSNSEVSRIGMSLCTESKWFVECRGALLVFGKKRDVTLKFDVKHKKLSEISLKVIGPNWSEETATQIFSELAVSPCVSQYEEKSTFSLTCFGPPDQVRRVVWANHYYSVSARAKDGRAIAWFKNKQTADLRTLREREFEQGR